MIDHQNDLKIVKIEIFSLIEDLIYRINEWLFYRIRKILNRSRKRSDRLNYESYTKEFNVQKLDDGLNHQTKSKRKKILLNFTKKCSILDQIESNEKRFVHNYFKFYRMQKKKKKRFKWRIATSWSLVSISGHKL